MYRNAIDLQRQVTQLLGSGPKATRVNFTDIGDEGRLARDKNILLGAGSMTKVFLGTFRQPVTNKPQLVAIKQFIYNTDADYANSRREVENLQELNHSNVVRYISADKNEEFNIMFIALELCRGSLVDIFNHKHDVFKKPFILKNHMSCDNWSFKKHLLLGIAAGLEYVHDQRFLHRDLKPQNILIRDDNDQSIYGYKAVICDFGLTKQMKDGRTQLSLSQEAVGTHGWMAKEVLKAPKGKKHEVTPAIDVFAYGCIVHYVLSEKRTEQHMHPFGSDLHRDTSILRGKRFSYISMTLQRVMARVSETDDFPSNYNNLGEAVLADMLVDNCICGDSAVRLSASEIQAHPLFWPYRTKMQWNEQMFNSYKDKNFQSETVIVSMETTWSSLKSHEYATLVPEAWDYNIMYRAKTRRKELSNDAASTLFNCLMRIIRNIQQHYHDAVTLSPTLGDVLAPGDDEALGRYFFENVPMSFPVIYMYFKYFQCVSSGDIVNEIHRLNLLRGTLKYLHSKHPAL